MALAALIGFNVLNSIASLVLLSVGLGVIFGMMKIINLAHGEFLMLGAYATVIRDQCRPQFCSLPCWWSRHCSSAPSDSLVERGIIRFLYGRMIDTMLATWGLSLFLVGIITTVFGTTVKGVAAPLGGFAIGDYQASAYSVFMIVMAVAVLVGLAHAALHPLRPDRARDDAEPRHGGRTRRFTAAHLHGDLRAGRGADRTGRWRAGADFRRRRRLWAQPISRKRLHHRDRRRRLYHHRHGLASRLVRLHQPGRRHSRPRRCSAKSRC